MTDETVEIAKRNQRLLDGENGDPGIRSRLRDLEEWREQIDRERTFVKALLIGLALGVGLNLVGVLEILSRLGGI